MIITSTSITCDLLFGCLLASLAIFYKYRFGYWKRQGLEYLPPSFPLGNISDLFFQKLSFGDQFASFYKQFKAKNLRHGGVFVWTIPCYVPVDLNIIKDILIKDFANFIDRGFYVNEENDPLSGNLFSLEGNKWRNLRAKLTAAFTSGKIKMMFEIITATSKNLEKLIDDTHSQGPFQIKDILSRFTIDVISSCAFGLESNAIANPETSKFKEFARRIFQNTLMENIKNLSLFSLPKFVIDFLKLKVTKPDVEEFVLKIVKDTVEYRETNNIYRKDFLHLLLQLKNRGKLSDDEKIINHAEEIGENTININELAAQVFVFFFAGFETSSTVMTFAFYELSKHQDIQDQLRKEIRSVLAKHNNQITYEAVQEMTYLDQIINETLRKYPALPMLNRLCNTDYQIRDSDVIVGKGSMIVIPIIAIQNDPEHFPNPDLFDPDRFSEENKQLIHPMAFMPFGQGPRNCIGLRFGLIQTKVGLIALLRNHKSTINKKTIEPIEFDPGSFTLATKSEIYVNFERIN